MIFDRDYNNGFGFPTERRISPVLHEVKPSYLFDFSFGMSPEHQLLLVEMFYAAYGHRQIGTVHLATFKNWVRSRYLAKWPRYKRLYQTEALVENPFLTHDVTEQEAKNATDISKNYSHTRNGGNQQGTESHDNYQTNLEQGYNAAIGYNGSRSQSSQKTATERKEAFKHEMDELTVRLFSDTPQTKVLDGASDSKPDANVPWNNGYLTTANRDHDSYTELSNTHNGESGITYSDGCTGGYDGSSGSNHTAGTQQGAGGSKNYSDYSAEAIGTGIAERIAGEKIIRQRKGWEGATASAILSEYRETFLNLDGDLISEFSDLFIGVF